MGETNGKGDKPRPVNKKQYDKNYDKIFKKVKDEQRPLQTEKIQNEKKAGH